MTATVISTTNLTLSGADPAAQNITVPADCTAVYVFWGFWADYSGDGVSSMTLGGVAASQSFAATPVTVSPYWSGNAGVYAWYNPTTGVQSLDIAWDVAPVEGPTCTVVFVKGGDTTSWRTVNAGSSGYQTDPGSGWVFNTAVGDLILKNDYRYDSTGVNPPGLTTGWTNHTTFSNASASSRLSSLLADASTEAVRSENEDWSSLVAISIPPTSGVSGQIKVWNGSTWVAKPLKYWNGSAWVTKPLKYWNGSAWVVTPY